MVSNPWRSLLSRALHRNRSQPHSRYFQLATVRIDGKPANRTVVFRGFLNDTDLLQMVADLHSDKINQMAQNPWSEICWYFSKTREQFRLLGRLSLVNAESLDEILQKARHTRWQALSDNARLQFSEAYFRSPITEADYPSKTVPLENFALLLFDPIQIDYLNLRDQPHSRCHFVLDSNNQWVENDSELKGI